MKMVYNFVMSFNTVNFFIFLILAFISYWAVNNRYRLIVLLILNAVFYLAGTSYWIVLVCMILLSYLFALKIDKLEGRNRKILFVVSVIVCLIPLLLLKYWNFTVTLFRLPLPLLNIVAPLGISFFTFEIISYLVDVYKGLEAEKDLLCYSAYVSFFPNISSGPIERAKRLLPILKQERKFDYDQASYGLKLFAWGLFKKFVVADNIASYIDPIFAKSQRYFGLILVIVIIIYPIQIYADFSGYSNMVSGIARLFGIDLVDNFKAPYFSNSIKQFWSKWHISLSSWLKDYIYIPLGGNRKGQFRKYLNLITTFVISGLWHGASINYLIWGLLHGVLQVIEDLIPFLKKKNDKFSWIRMFILYGVLCVTFIFFRCETFTKAIHFLNPMNLITYFSRDKLSLYFVKGFNDLRIENLDLFILLSTIIVMAIYDYFYTNKIDLIDKVSGLSLIPRWIIYVVFVLLIVYLSFKGTGTFIYLNY